MIGMTDINPAAKAALEDHRKPNGRFGAQDNSSPELALGGEYVPGQPVYGTMTFEEYAHPRDEDPTQVGVQKVDVASILDTFPLDEVQTMVSDPYAYSDDIGYKLQSQGALTHPSHPFVFTPDVDELDAYLDYRTRNGLTEALAEEAAPAPENLAAAWMATKDAIAALADERARLEEQKEAAEESLIRAVMTAANVDADVVALQLDDPKAPVTAYSANPTGFTPVQLDPEAQTRIVSELRRHLGEDPGVVGGRGTSRVVTLREPAA